GCHRVGRKGAVPPLLKKGYGPLYIRHPPGARNDGPDADRTVAVALERSDDAIRIRRRADDDEADPHVEHAEHLVVADLAALLEQTEHRRNGPRAAIDLRAGVLGQNPRQILGDAAAGDVR